MGWNIGANDAANCIGTCIGSGIINFRRAVGLMAVFVILGSVLQGHHVMKTVGKGIVVCDPESYISDDKLQRLELIEVDADHIHCVTLSAAKQKLDSIWDKFFEYDSHQ